MIPYDNETRISISHGFRDIECKHLGVMTLTFWGSRDVIDQTSSITWPLGSQYILL